MMSRLVFTCLLGLVTADLGIFHKHLIKRESAAQDIVGGSNADKYQFPWQLALKRFGEFICGAALISPSWALTAAHCVSQEFAGSYTASGGILHYFDPGVTRTVSYFERHADYDKLKLGFPNDIALIKFSCPFPVSDHVKPVEMASETNADFIGEKCVISGWGFTAEKSPAAETLQYTNIPVISNSECAKDWTGVSNAQIRPGHICVYDSLDSVCSGDSGGPLVCNGVLAGITSWAVDSCKGIFPSVYSRVSYYKRWIDSVVRD